MSWIKSSGSRIEHRTSEFPFKHVTIFDLIGRHFIAVGGAALSTSPWAEMELVFRVKYDCIKNLRLVVCLRIYIYSGSQDFDSAFKHDNPLHGKQSMEAVLGSSNSSPRKSPNRNGNGTSRSSSRDILPTQSSNHSNGSPVRNLRPVADEGSFASTDDDEEEEEDQISDMPVRKNGGLSGRKNTKLSAFGGKKGSVV